MSFQQKLNALWQLQPDVPDAEKLLRIDRLACLEFRDDIAFNPNFSGQWFFVLMTAVLEGYLQKGLVAPTNPLVKEIIAHHAYRFQSETLLNRQPLAKHQRAMYYTVLREKLRVLVSGNLSRLRSVAEQHGDSDNERVENSDHGVPESG